VVRTRTEQHSRSLLHRYWRLRWNGLPYIEQEAVREESSASPGGRPQATAGNGGRVGCTSTVPHPDARLQITLGAVKRLARGQASRSRSPTSVPLPRSSEESEGERAHRRRVSRPANRVRSTMVVPRPGNSRGGVEGGTPASSPANSLNTKACQTSHKRPSVRRAARRRAQQTDKIWTVIHLITRGSCWRTRSE